MSAVSDTTTSAQQIAEAIAALPPLPSTAQEILTCFGDEFIDADKVTSVVEGDPGICAKLLGLANSAYFGLAEPVNSMAEAISRVLGVDTVRSLVLAMAIQQSFNSRRCPAFNAEKFWTQSLLTAECCKRLVASDPEATDTLRDLAYAGGLCHNLGMMALAHMEPERTNEVLQAHRDAEDGRELKSRFVAEFETDHRCMTAELARLWSLPKPMVDAYTIRAYPEMSCDERLGAVVTAAATAVGNLQLPDDRRKDLNKLGKPFGLGDEELQELAIFPERQTERVQSLASNMTG